MAIGQLGRYYYLGNSRSQEQTDDMIDLEARGICMFCPSYIDQRVAYETQHWMVTPNEFPYQGTKVNDDGINLHMLLVPKQHEEDVLDLPIEAFIDLRKALVWTRNEFGSGYWGWGGRNGDCRYTGATVRHVHIHFLIGDPAKAEETPVRLKLSSAPTEMPPIR